MRTASSLLSRAPAPAALALALVACGATPPQAPLPYAKKLDSATSGISSACGEADQVTAFPGDHRADLVSLEMSAFRSVRKLGSVFARNPAWIYQGETVRQIVHDSSSMLGSCGLHAAQEELLRRTQSRIDRGTSTSPGP
jgi:hypothetical protein